MLSYGVMMPDTSAVTSLDELEDVIWSLTDDVMKLADEVEAQEPLQAKQSMAIIMEKVRAMETFVNAIPEKEEDKK